VIDEVTITLPVYAVRYLREMCKRDREFLACLADHSPAPSLPMLAGYDSLDAIECALPEEKP
jgi:hypothetical protein